MISYTNYLEWIVNDRYKTENFLGREPQDNKDNMEKHLFEFAELDEVIENVKEAVVVLIDVPPNIIVNYYEISDDKKWISIDLYEHNIEVIKRILQNLNSVRFLEL